MASSFPFPVVLPRLDPKMPLLFLLIWRPNFVPFLQCPPSNSLAQLPQNLRPTFSRLPTPHPHPPTNQSLPGLTCTCARETRAAGTQAYPGPICRKRGEAREEREGGRLPDTPDSSVCSQLLSDSAAWAQCTARTSGGPSSPSSALSPP